MGVEAFVVFGSMWTFLSETREIRKYASNRDSHLIVRHFHLVVWVAVTVVTFKFRYTKRDQVGEYFTLWNTFEIISCLLYSVAITFWLVVYLIIVPSVRVQLANLCNLITHCNMKRVA